MLSPSQYYGIGAVLAVGVISGLGYYLYQAKKGEVNNIVPLQQPCPQTRSFHLIRLQSKLNSASSTCSQQQRHLVGTKTRKLSICDT